MTVKAMQPITKNIFLNTAFCPTLGWRLRNGKIHIELSPAEQFRMEQGKEIGKLARTLYKDGIFVTESGSSAAKRTRDLLKDPTASVIFEAAFIAQSCVARSDILVRDKKSWELIEVKSGVSIKDELIDDLAYTTLIAEAAGFRPSAISLMLVDKNFRLGMPTERLFVKTDVTMRVIERTKEFKPLLDSIDAITLTPDEPEPELTYNCKQCGEFAECLGKEIVSHIFEIPRISQKAAEKLIAAGITSIHEIPEGHSLTDNQRRVVDCVKCGRMQVDPGLNEKLATIRRPAFYLDFETMMTAIPLWPDVAPYDQIPTQYSLHICDGPGKNIRHIDYLADPRRDCRRELAERLIRDLKGEGSIVAYSSFEKTTISNLARLFPNLTDKLQSLIDRIVDLEACVKCITHPEFCGRTSIKVVLPVLVPELSYEGLEIANGDAALVTFALMAQGKMGEAEMELKRAALLEYCKMDTMAMVRLHEALRGFVDRR